MTAPDTHGGTRGPPLPSLPSTPSEFSSCLGELFVGDQYGTPAHPAGAEGAGARLLAFRGNVPEVARIEENMREADEAVRAGDAERYAQLVHEFHDLIVIGADNSKLEAHYRTLMNQLAYERLVRTSLAQPGRLSESDHEHHRVLDLILAKDGDGAERVMREHVSRSHQALMAGMDERQQRS